VWEKVKPLSEAEKARFALEMAPREAVTHG